MGSRAVMGSRATGVVGVVVVVSLVASSCSVSVSGADQVSTGGGWDPVSLSAISVNGSGVGGRLPVYGGSVVSDGQGLAVSLQPVLKASKAPAVGQYQFTIMMPQSANGDHVWQGQGSSNEVQVPAGVLKQGNVYVWQAVEVATNRTFGPYAMLVDAQRAGLQSSQAFGPVGVDLDSGELTYGVSLRGVNGASGALGANLMFRVGAPAGAGLPAGWSLVPKTAQALSYVQTFPVAGQSAADYTGAVSLVSATGMTQAFQLQGGGYVAVSAAGRAAPTGQSPTVVKNPDGGWTVTSASGLVSVFAPAGADGVAGLVDVFNGTQSSPTFQYSDGRLTRVVDSVSSDLWVDVQYQGSGDCPDVPEGFVDAPDGGLCALSYPDGSATDVFLFRR